MLTFGCTLSASNKVSHKHDNHNQLKNPKDCSDGIDVGSEALYIMTEVEAEESYGTY